MAVKKAEEKVDDDAGTDDAKDDDKGSGGGGADSGSLDGRIRDLVREAVDSLLGDHGKGSSGSTRVDDEEALFQRVKKAQEKIRADEERDGKLAKVDQLEEKLTKVLEKPPARDGIAGKIQRALWGSTD